MKRKGAYLTNNSSLQSITGGKSRQWELKETSPIHSQEQEESGCMNA